jgi:hypothetical protein
MWNVDGYVRDILRRSGFVYVLLLQCEWRVRWDKSE